ncbi:MAG: hypothetical protein ACYDAA_18535 [Syntrophales bacterium]
MTDERCRLFEDCLAPLCPLDRSSLKGIWYADEEICRSRTNGNLPWIRAQRKIARVKAVGYFTLEMLSDIRTARKGMAGLDPNEDEQTQLRRWFGRHEKKRTSRGRNRREATSATEPTKGDQPDLFTPRSGDPEIGVSARLQNVTKRGREGKKLCRNRGRKRAGRKGTGKPSSRNGHAHEPPFSMEEKNDG